MTSYKTVVSWLAFLFLLYRGVFLSIVLVLDRVGLKPYPGPAASFYSYAGQVSLGESLKCSPLWACLAFMVIFPWLRINIARTGKSHLRHVNWDSFSLLINGIGRWAAVLTLLTIIAGKWPRGVLGFLIVTPYSQEDWFSFPFPALLLDATLALASAELIAPEIAIVASSGFTRFIDAVFFPGGREAKPPYTLKLARFYVENQRFEEAEAEYARMVSFYPDQPEAWQERLALAFQRPAPAEPAPPEVLAAALKAISKPADREALHRQFMELTGHLDVGRAPVLQLENTTSLRIFIHFSNFDNDRRIGAAAGRVS